MEAIRFPVLLSLLVGLASCQYQQLGVSPGAGTNPRGESTGLTRSVFVDANQTFLVKWDFDSDGEHITFELYVRTQGWVGFGLSSNGGMAGSDIVIGWVKDGKAFIEDRHATGEITPEIDEEQNYVLTEGHENDTHTVLKFRRKLDTCDVNDKPIKEGTQRFIYAWGPDDPTPGQDIPYHGSDLRGSRSVKLFAERDPKPELPDDVIHMDLLMDQYDVPAQDTSYWCIALKGPKLSRKHHLIKVEPLVQKGNEGFVHHIVVSACRGGIDEGFHGHQSQCRVETMPEPLKRCTDDVIVWGVGGGDFHWPIKAGHPILGDEVDPTYFLMEMHYDNPGLKSGIRDSSGLRFILTPTLREYDSGIISTGYRYDRPYQVLPPHFPTLTQYGYCPEDCLNQALQGVDSGIYIFANLLHVHLVGKALRLRHFRGDQELPVIDNEDEYDFTLQEFHHVQPEVNIKAGDSLLVECTYSTAHKDKLVVGGLSTSEEMCLGVFMYYPRIPLLFCESNPDVKWLMESMSGVSVQLNDSQYPHFFVDEGPMTGQSYLEILAGEKWELDSRRKKYQDLMNYAPHRVTCEHVGEYRTYNETSFPKRCFEEYEFPDTCGNRPVPERHCEVDVSGGRRQITDMIQMAICGLILLLK